MQTKVRSISPGALHVVKSLNMKLFNIRLHSTMLTHGISTANLAERIGVSTTIVRKWLKSPNCDMHAKHLLALAELFRVRSFWLATGNGAPDLWLAAQYTETELITLYRKLSASDKRMLIDVGVAIFRHAREKLV
jgi:hypothetical protein